MHLRLWRFATLMLAGLTMAMGFCHLMELPARMSWNAELWIASTVHGGLYRMFGTLGAAIDLAAVVATAVLAFLVRRRAPAVRRLAWLGAAGFVLALALWFALVLPVNLELATWLDAPPPPDWAAFRARWEYAHAANALIQTAGFAALLWSSLVETPG